jgi:DNA polymerase-1
VHTTYSQSTAVTGGSRRSIPNLQNIPVRTTEGRRIREAFIAPPARRSCRRTTRRSSFASWRTSRRQEPARGILAGEDVHRHTRSEVFDTPLDQVTSEQRRYAKVINFG